MKYRLSIILFFLTCSLWADDLRDEMSSSLKSLMPKVIEWRHDIHEFPELSNREFRTSKKVADHLESLGIEIETGIALSLIHI